MIQPRFQRPAPIRTDHSNAFANDTLLRRIPNIIRDVQRLNPDYPPSILKALDILWAEVGGGAPIMPLIAPAPDMDEWRPLYAARQGETWHTTIWFFAETFFYRTLLQTVRWWDSGRDPFAPNKNEELLSPSLWKLLYQALDIAATASVPLEDRLAELLAFAMWANRVDLSYNVGTAHGHIGDSADVLADDRAPAIAHLMRTPGDVHLIADNTGTELALDCVLVDVLLNTLQRRVVYHVKMCPTFVSDTMVSDVYSFLRACHAAQSPAHGLAARLQAAIDDGRLRLAPDFFWNTSRFMWELPPRLREAFSGAALVISKGDANYRRILGDCTWPEGAHFEDAAVDFPAALLALRTLKSDPIIGLPSGAYAALYEADPLWHINGKRGVMQFARLARLARPVEARR